VLDKTGTVTEGKPVVTDIIPAPGFTKEELLRLPESPRRNQSIPWQLLYMKRQ
jgi:Cu+-exporting ATPase